MWVFINSNRCKGPTCSMKYLAAKFLLVKMLLIGKVPITEQKQLVYVQGPKPILYGFFVCLLLNITVSSPENQNLCFFLTETYTAYVWMTSLSPSFAFGVKGIKVSHHLWCSFILQYRNSHLSAERAYVFQPQNKCGKKVVIYLNK